MNRFQNQSQSQSQNHPHSNSHGVPAVHSLHEAVLVVENLTIYREQYPAVQNVSFTLAEGTNTAVVGPNGAGKSTLIQALLGILPYQGGSVLMMGHLLGQDKRLDCTIRQQIAYLPQSFLFDRRIPMTVEELVGLGWDRLGFEWPWAEGRSRHTSIRTALSQVDAWHLRDQLLSSLSGGELKRVLLAYCLVRPRRLLVLDEAPAGLDARSEGEFYQLLDRLKREQGWAILQISHDLDMVQRSCDRVICLNQTIRCQGTPDVALSDQPLTETYGSEFVRYRHSCRIQDR